MGKPGPRRKPLAHLEASGSWLAKSRAGDSPQVAVCIPDCPAWVSATGRKFWPEIAGELAAIGVMGRPYSIVLGLLVDALASYIEAQRILQKEGSVIETKQGTVAHPAASQAAGAWDRVLKAAREFGMTPAAVTNVKLGGKGKAGGDEKNKSRYFRTA
jgi:P27 family predicted phage terminase small subunit